MLLHSPNMSEMRLENKKYLGRARQTRAFLFSTQDHRPSNQLHNGTVTSSDGVKEHTSFLVDLNSGLVAVDTDNFADEFAVTDAHLPYGISENGK